MEEVSLMVIQRPVKVAYDCPHCDYENEIDYSAFCGGVGEPCDWDGEIIHCPNCGKEIKIDGVDWD